MKIGSIAIALSAEYGEFWPSAISLSGSSWTNEHPASAIHAPSLGRSGSSPMPQLSFDGTENSGTSSPAWRPRKKSRGIDALQQTIDGRREDVRLWQQTHDQKRFVRKIEEVSRMNDDTIALEEIERHLFLAPRRGHTEDSRPPGVRRQHRRSARLRDARAQDAVVRADARENLIADRAAGVDQRRGGDLRRRRDRQIRVADPFKPFERGGDEIVRTRDGDPAELHLRQAGALRETAEAEQQAGG